MNGFNQMPPLFTEAVRLFQQGNLNGAEERCLRLITDNPLFPPAHDVLGNIHLRRGAFAEAEADFAAALNLQPANVEFRISLASAQLRQENYEVAEENARAALAQAPGNMRGLSILGTLLRNLGRFEEAVETGRAAVAVNARFAPAHAELGAALEGLERFEEAIASYDAALRLVPNFALVWCAKGKALAVLNRHDEALTAFRRAVELAPGDPSVNFSFGQWNQKRGYWEDAALCFARALDARPDYAEAASALGVVFHSLYRLKDAVEAYNRALVIKPDLVDALVGLGRVHIEAGRDDEAVPLLERANALRPADEGILDMLVMAQLQLCAWDGIGTLRKALVDRIREDRCVVNPFVAILAGADATDQFRSARQWARTVTPTDAPLFSHAPSGERTGRRLRIGYMSSDLHEHPLAHLVAGVFEHHDRKQFELHAYSLGFDDDSPMRRRIAACFNKFVQIDQMGAAEAARRIHADGIDILVDLNGYTNHSNPAVLAYRPAPLQVNFQGYPATMGSGFMDYIVGDPVTLPMSQQPHFAERIVHLPYSYHPNAVTRSMAETMPSRAQFGLPESGFVFCCFNNASKFTPEIFAVWMRLLKAVPDAVLWLLDRNGTVKDNILAQVRSHGVDSSRVVLAPRVPLPQHLARQQLADLFLDTLPYNAHVTASDALWVGLPLLTCLGDGFAGRVAGSLLKPLGLDELVTASLEEYEARALELARDRERLSVLRSRLSAEKVASPLFDTGLYTRHLEAAYLRMWDIWSAGKPPEGFAVAP